jgi:hypothetical protein
MHAAGETFLQSTQSQNAEGEDRKSNSSRGDDDEVDAN